MLEMGKQTQGCLYINTGASRCQAPSGHRAPASWHFTVEIFQRDIRFKFSAPKRGNRIIWVKPKADRPKRGGIRYFSSSSRRRLRHLLRNTDGAWRAFVTLTYPGDYTTDGRESKRHLNTFLQYLRRRGIRYIWILEFQDRGAPHYHVLIDKWLDKNELSERWYQIVGSGDARHLRAGTQIKRVRSNCVAYLTSYVKKISQKQVPDNFQSVGRFWGSTKNLLERKTFTFRARYEDFCRNIRPIRRWYRAHLRALWGIKWRWRGSGFTVLDGADYLEFCCRGSTITFLNSILP